MLHPRRLAFLTFALASILHFSLVAATAQGLDPRTLKAVDDAVEAEMKESGAIGVGIGIVQDRKTVAIRYYGQQDRMADEPVTDQTMFRWASISKTLTAIAAMQLVEQGKLDLEADVRTYVPEFPDKDVKITSRDLLCHQSGIVHYWNGPVIRTKRNYDVEHPFQDVVQALDTFKESPLVAAPREKFSYSTHAYILLSAVVERAGKQRFADQIHERIATPLGMDSLRPDYQWVDIPNRATGYRRILGQVIASSDTDVSWKLAGGGYISTVGDLTRYMEGILQGKLLEQETWEMVGTPQRTKDGAVTSVGLGFFVDGDGDRFRLAHSGSQEKTRTRMVTYPLRGSGVCVMSNSEFIDPGRVSTAVYSALQN